MTKRDVSIQTGRILLWHCTDSAIVSVEPVRPLQAVLMLHEPATGVRLELLINRQTGMVEGVAAHRNPEESHRVVTVYWELREYK